MSDWSRRRRRLARGSAALGVLLLLTGIALLPASSGPEIARMTYGAATLAATGSTQNVTVNLTDQPAFDPAALTAPAGTTLDLTLHNIGAYNHTFTLSPVANYTLPTNTSPSALAAFFAANGSLLNVAVPPGSTVNASLALPLSDAGSSFEYVSLTAYQFEAGMSGVLHVAFSSSAGGFSLSTQTEDSLRFVPDALAIPNATHFPITVSVEVTNAGTTPHTFTIEGQDNNTLLSSNFSGYFQAHPPLANVQVPTSSGVPVWANFTLTGKGAFEFICEIPGHFAGGMFGWLYVGYAPSPPPAPPSTAIVDVPLLIAAGGLLGLAVLLTLVGTFVGRFPRSPPRAGHP